MSPHGSNAPANDAPESEVQQLKISHPSVGVEPHEARHELREFLKVVRPDWSHFNRQGTTGLDKVMAKLDFIGVKDVWDLMHRVESNDLNEELYTNGKTVFSDKTIELFRRQKPFLTAMEHLRSPFYRQTGLFAPVPQLLAKKNRWSKAKAHKTGLAAHMQSTSNSLCGSPTRPRHHSQPQLVRRPDARPFSASDDEPRRQAAIPDDAAPEALAAMAKAAPRPASHGEPRLRNSPTIPNRRKPGPLDKVNTFDDEAWSSPLEQRVSLKHVRTGKEHQCWSAPAISQQWVDGSSSSSFQQGMDDNSASPTALAASQGLGRAASNSSSFQQGSIDRVEGPPTNLSSPLARSRSSTMDVVQRKVSSAAATNDCPTSEAESAALEEHVARIQRSGAQMHAAPRVAKWTNMTNQTLLAHGELMVEEHRALVDKKRLLGLMQREGAHSVTRKVVTTNIRNRMRDDTSHEAKAALEAHYDGASIRKNLEAMAKSRRELSIAKFGAQKDCNEVEKVDYAEKFGFMGHTMTTRRTSSTPAE